MLALFFAFPLFAQLEKGYIHLKNGTVLKGKYQYSNDLNKLKVVSAGNIWVFDSAEIDSITTQRTGRINEIENRMSGTGIFFHTEIGLLAGNSENSQPAPFSFTGSLNYVVTDNLSAGLGAGIEFLKESYMPLFVNAEYKLRNSYSTPYLFLQAGYEVPLEDSRAIYYDVYPMWSSIWPGPDYYNETLNPKGGILLNPGIGYMQMFSPGFGMSFAFGYRFHRLHYKGENDYGLNIDYNRLSIKIGFIFN